MTELYGLIGYPVSHSFSKQYFADKFAREQIEGAEYQLFPLERARGLPGLVVSQPKLKGLNVTIPHKKTVIPLLDGLDYKAHQIGAVNVIRITARGQLIGYNTDYTGFAGALKEFLGGVVPGGALVLGNGGSAQSVKAVLSDMRVPYLMVSRSIQASTDFYTYRQLTPELVHDHPLIINTTPLGMHPDVETAPPIPYEALSGAHYLFDLVYNPEETRFMHYGKQQGAKVCNGLRMLELQAEASWRIWQGLDG